MLNNIGLGPIGNVSFTPLPPPPPPPPPWNMTSISYSGLSFDSSAQDAAQYLHISADGTKMYARNPSSKVIFEYSLSTAYNISTASFSGNSGSDAGVFGTHFFISPDGQFLYSVQITPGYTVNQYTLSSPGDISTISGITNSALINNTSNIDGLTLSLDGLHLYLAGPFSAVDQYTLGTPWDLSTCTFTQTMSLVGGGSETDGQAISPDGKTLIQSDHVSENIDTFTLSVPWDISTAVHAHTLGGLDPPVTVSSAFDITVSTDGTKLYTGVNPGTIYEYFLT